jgi:hypothetical protein
MVDEIAEKDTLVENPHPPGDKRHRATGGSDIPAIIG